LIIQLLLCPVLFSYLYQLSNVEKLKLNYFASRSQCDYCKRRLNYFEIIPILSFIYLKGKTNCCHNKLSALYLIGELLALCPLLFLSYVNLPIDSTTFLTIYIFLLVFGIYDIKTLSLPLHLLFVFTIISYFLVQGHLNHFIWMTTLLHILYFSLRQGMGYGDILLFSILSYVLPYQAFVLTILLTFICAGIYAIVSVSITHKLRQAIPLIPFIFIAFNLMMLFHQYLIFGGDFL